MTFRGIVWTAALTVLALFWYGTYQLVFADGLKNAAALAVDRLTCGLNVQQKDVDLQVVKGMLEYNVNYTDAVSISSDYGAKLTMEIMRRNVLKEYCNIRREELY